MKTYKEFINKAKPVELDEVCIPGTGTCVAAGAIATAVKTAPVWAPLLKKAVLGTALVGGLGGAAYDYDQKMKGKKGIFPDFTKMFNRGKTTNAIDDILWKDTKTKKTDIPDGIGKDIVHPGELKPEVTKKNTEVGDGTAGTAVGGQSAVGGRAIPLSRDIAISQAGVNKAKKTPFKSFRLKGGLPTTPHNVGRRVNPQ